MLISSCAVVERTVTECRRKLKAPVVREKSFVLEQKGGTFFQADGKRGRMDYPSLRWKGKSSRGSEFRMSTRKQPCGPGLSKQLCRALTLSTESCDIQSNEIGQMDNRNQAR